MDTGSAESHLLRFRDTGDPAALGALFDATAPALFRVALRLAPDPASAEDALQETFLDLFDVAREWDPARPALPWLAGVLRHRVERVRRTASRRPDPRRLPPPAPPPDPPAAAAAAEDRDRARRAMLDLEEPYRSVALLRWQYGLEPAEIAEVRGEPPGTVWSLLSRAKEKLGKSLAGTNALAVAFLPGAGLDSVRTAVVRHAAAKAAAATAATASTVGGGLLVSKKAFVAVALLVIALGTTLSIFLPRGGFRGRVVDAATGRPVAGARVVLQGTTPEETVTDSEGRFTLAAEGRENAHVTAETEGLVGRSLRGAPGGNLEFVLERGDTVEGRVVSANGTAVAGAHVSIHPRFREWWRKYPSAVTGADGRFRCTTVDRDNYHNCVVRADGHGRLVVDFNPARDGPGTVGLGDLTLPPARRVEGVFLSGRGAPLPGVQLYLRGPLDLGRASLAEGTTEKTATDAAGRFRFEGMAPGRYDLANDYFTGVPHISRELLVGEVDLLGVELRIENTGWLRVRVVDEVGAPQPGVKVFDSSGGVYALSGEDGIAVIENLPPGSRVRPTVQCGEEWQGWAFVDIRQPELVRPNGAEVTLVVARAARITGVVRDEAGDPVQGAIVSGWGNTADTTRGDGTFRLSVPEGRTVDLIARLNPPDPCLRAEEKGVKAPARGIDLRFRRIPRTGSLTIRLLDASGLPVPRLGMTVYAGEQRNVRTDDAGRALLEGLPAAETPVFIWIEPQGPDDPWPLPGGGVLPSATRCVPDGREVEVRLVPGADIRGTVLDAEGRPLAGAKVHARRGEEWVSVQGTTDARGRFRVVVPAGEAALSVRAFVQSADGRAGVDEAQDVRPGTEDLVLHPADE